MSGIGDNEIVLETTKKDNAVVPVNVNVWEVSEQLVVVAVGCGRYEH